jgi:hypothetical protein
MPMTKADIIRQASTLLGKSQVNQTSTGGPAGNALEDAYERLLPALLEADGWRFATATVQLNRLEQTSNIARWHYVYQLPANYLRLNFLIPRVDYDIQERHLYSNATTLTAEYRFLVDVSKLPATFIDFFIYKIAAECGPVLNINKALVETLSMLADKKYLKALASNGQSVPTKEIVDNPFIDAGYW